MIIPYEVHEFINNLPKEQQEDAKLIYISIGDRDENRFKIIQLCFPQKQLLSNFKIEIDNDTPVFDNLQKFSWIHNKFYEGKPKYTEGFYAEHIFLEVSETHGETYALDLVIKYFVPLLFV